jgi:hypothetical protein
MTPELATDTVSSFLNVCQELFDISKTAFRNKKSLRGANPYGNKFHSALIALGKLKAGLNHVIQSVELDDASRDEVNTAVQIMESETEEVSKRSVALKKIKYICESQVLPKIERLQYEAIPRTEQVLPMDVVKKTRDNIVQIVLQANGCYENKWFDACAVMIRRLVETLIIEVYESKGRGKEITDHDNNFLMLRELIDKILNASAWTLSRETKQSLPNLKLLGDRSAHNRHYLAKKLDVDKNLPGLRVVVDDLLHLASLK